MIVYEPYATVPFSDLVTDIVYDAPDLPNDAAAHFLRRSAIQMARSSNALVRRTHLCAQYGVEEYKLLPPNCEEEIVAVLSVSANAACATPVMRLHGRPAETCCSWCAPLRSWFEAPDSLFIQGVTGPTDLAVEFSVTPSLTACSIDKAFMERHYEIILAGAKALAFELQDKPWSSRTKAEQYRMQYGLGSSDAAVEAMMGGQRGVLRGSFRNPVV